MLLTPRNSEEQAMLDLMEMRGFELVPHVTQWYLKTPDGYQFAIQFFENLSKIQCAFACFESLNSNYK